jgi:hypothetical protein
MHDNILGDLSVQYKSIPEHALVLVERLNHSDPEELLRYWPFLPGDARRWIRTGTNKIEAYPETFGREADNYLELLGIVALSTWAHAQKFCLCRVQNRHGASQPCHLWNLCPPCSYAQRKRHALAAYLTHFRHTSWYFVTISYQGVLGDGTFDGDDVKLRWLAATQALRRCQEHGYLRGLMTRCELHLESFLPLGYFPHVHSIVDADNIDRGLIASEVFAYRCPETGDQITRPVSVHHRPLSSDRAFAYALSYVNKPLNLVDTYQKAWPLAAKDNRRLAVQLHAEVNEFLDAMSAFTSNFHQVRYAGTMHWRSRDSLRVSPREQKAQRSVVAAILVENSLDSWDEGDDEPATVFQPPDRGGR